MSAPQTNLDRQRKRHRGPLIGIALVTLFALAVIVYWLFEEVAGSDPPAPAGTDAGTVNEPAQSEIPPDALGPETQTGIPGATTAPPAPEPEPQESAPVPNTPQELTPD